MEMLVINHNTMKALPYVVLDNSTDELGDMIRQTIKGEKDE